jgi:hypothetical protein
LNFGEGILVFFWLATILATFPLIGRVNFNLLVTLQASSCCACCHDNSTNIYPLTIRVNLTKTLNICQGDMSLEMSTQFLKTYSHPIQIFTSFSALE